MRCTHLAGIRTVAPSARGFEGCLKIGSPWVHLRLCRTCGHVGCCDSSPNRHATAHFAAGRPIIEGYDPPEGWGWCCLDRAFFDLAGRTTPQLGPISRYDAPAGLRLLPDDRFGRASPIAMSAEARRGERHAWRTFGGDQPALA